MYKLNRSAFKAGTLEDIGNHSSYYKNLSWQERFKIAMYLNSIAFKLLGSGDIKMDKTKFSVKSSD
jgi:hypothetical protein